MVNRNRVKQKLPELLVDGPVTNRTNLYKYWKVQRSIRVAERKNWLLLDEIVHDITKALEKLEKSLM